MINDYFYGDNARWFLATVVNSSDPEGQGRVQVRIHGIHTDDESLIPEHTLPWAETLMPVTEGGTSGIGKIPQLQNTALVFGIFLDGKQSQAPLILGSLHKFEQPSTVQVDNAYNTGQGEKVAPSTSAPGGKYTPQSYKQEYTQASGNVTKLRLICFKWLVLQGYTPVMAAAICGNLQAESGFKVEADSTKATKGKETSLGIAQWNTASGAGFRGVKLKEFAAARGKSTHEELFIQLEFLDHELRGPGSDHYNSNGGFFSVYTAMEKCEVFEGGVSENNATWVFLDKYENPELKREKLNKREIYAREAYEQYFSALEAEYDEV